MATTGTVLAKNMSFELDGTVITCQVNCELNMSTEMFETTCKDSGAWSEPLPGTKSWTASGEINVAFDATYGIEEIFTAWYNQSSVAFVFTTGVNDDKEFIGTAYVSSSSVSSQGNDAAVTGTFELTGNGALIYQTVS